MPDAFMDQQYADMKARATADTENDLDGEGLGDDDKSVLDGADLGGGADVIPFDPKGANDNMQAREDVEMRNPTPAPEMTTKLMTSESTVSSGMGNFVEEMLARDKGDAGKPIGENADAAKQAQEHKKLAYLEEVQEARNQLSQEHVVDKKHAAWNGVENGRGADSQSAENNGGGNIDAGLMDGHGWNGHGRRLRAGQ
jgi:hypothetical protein